MSSPGKLNTLFSLLRQGRWTTISQATVRNLHLLGIHWMDYLVYRGDGNTIAGDIMLPGIEIRGLTESDLSALESIEGKTPEVFALRLAAGHTGLGIILEERIIGYAWLNPDKIDIPVMNLSLPLKQHEIYLYNGAIIKDLRCRGIYGYFLIKLLEEKRKAGRMILAATESNNLLSRNTHKKAGFLPLSRHQMLKIGPYRFLSRVQGMRLSSTL